LVVLEHDLEDGDGSVLIDDLRDHYGDRAPPFVFFSSTPPRRRPEGLIASVDRRAGGLRELTPIVTEALRSAAHARSGVSRPGTRPIARVSSPALSGARPARSTAGAMHIVEERSPTEVARDPRRE
jgi:hypothetical protein